ncbi:MAG: glutamine synthetase type III, partial [Clostridiales bacterium]|nr:glutamine synthetase type III [Clostridiales bacterium]
HNNWSLSTESGVNLLDPGDNPMDNAQFLLFLSAVIKAVDTHQDLLRIAASSAGNDHRLGANEAPPAIVSMFLGEDLEGVIDALAGERSYEKKARMSMDIGVDVLPRFRRDSTDRNRTSPFAFTGNKFEFRSIGASFSVADANTTLNTIVAGALREFADQLEAADDFNAALNALVRDTITAHKRIVFNGNNYSRQWADEAAARGLLNLRSAAEAIPHLTDPKNIRLFGSLGVFSEAELRSRQEIMLESYCKVLHIEALTMLDMVSQAVLPAVLEYSARLAEGAVTKSKLGVPFDTEEVLARRLSGMAASIHERYEKLSDAVLGADGIRCHKESAAYYHDTVFSAMQELRAAVDETELTVAKKYWPYPSYGDILFGVR